MTLCESEELKKGREEARFPMIDGVDKPVLVLSKVLQVKVVEADDGLFAGLVAEVDATIES